MDSLGEDLRERFPLARCPRAVRELLTGEAPDEPWALACSGGPDSLFLLYWWAAHFPERVRWTRVLHFDHRVRGNGEEEAARVRAWAVREGYGFALGRRGEAGPAAEADLRAARFAFFGRELSTGRPCRHLLLGHNREDAAETLLLRLARGSHPEGLAAPRAVARHGQPVAHLRLRPLLGLPAAEIRSFLREKGIEPVQDPSNLDRVPERNRIRHEVLPAWEAALGRDVAAGLLRSQEELAEWVDHLAGEAARFLRGGATGERLRVEELRARSPALRRFVLQRWAAERDQRISPAVVDLLVEALGKGEEGTWTADGDVRLRLRGGVLHREKPPESPGGWGRVGWSPGVRLYGPAGDCLERRSLSAGGDPVVPGSMDPAREAFLGMPGDDLLRVRSWAPGDRYRPLGAPGSRKLQDLFTDRRIHRRVRRQLPVVEMPGRGIVWVPGLPPAEACRIDRESPSVLHLTYRPPSRSYD